MKGLVVVSLCTAGLGIALCAVAAMVTGRAKPKNALGIAAIGSSMVTLGDILTGVKPLAGFAAMDTAILTYLWWTHGGGDGTKKRLRALARKFTPVRRTAPQHA